MRETILKWTWKVLLAVAIAIAALAFIFILPATLVENLSQRAKNRWLITRSKRKRKEIDNSPEARDWVKAETVE